jgi:hypothetical protein
MGGAIMELPGIAKLAREGVALTALQAMAGKLWLAAGGSSVDEDGAVLAAVDAFWRSQPGDDPYWDFLSTRMMCDACGETYKVENLGVCPNCYRTLCYRCGRDCRCGHAIVG